MANESHRIAFAGFLRRLAAGRVKAIEWNRFVIQHYPDPELEEIRRSLVRLGIAKNGGMQWSESEVASLQHWYHILRADQTDDQTRKLTRYRHEIPDFRLTRYAFSAQLTFVRPPLYSKRVRAK
jgi:hypothetical protein